MRAFSVVDIEGNDDLQQAYLGRLAVLGQKTGWMVSSSRYGH